ncbi:type I-F CRISPR-associated protein Csy2 [Aliiglaciecola sp. M165]|uniref:type I-F CRISPR-associated protein Csy2 n=1 Tax=Aliiglaciecola sp. M165 TaxID=2593649 RepID=UPI00117D116A|nr:type I-F CRISPR-associated protein Csy2 [Aliiglaciecola sp. M165]TRY33963.1 hypothetical protein FM019_01505 [Aliiglaciecola sp. M165]
MASNEITSLLNIENHTDRNVAWKKALSPITPPLDVTGNEKLACVVLANLTWKLSLINNVFDSNDARAKLRDKNWIQRCIKTFRYRHTHNLKYPDYRAKGAIRLSPIGVIPKGCFSSSKLISSRLGWSQNSADINYATFLCADFVWQGELLTLGEAIIGENISFTKSLIESGMFKKDLKLIRNELSQIPINQTESEYLSHQLTNLRFPKHSDGYVCLTPVPSHIVQVAIHSWSVSNFRQSETMYCPRSSSVGSLPACVGGKIKVLKSLPKGLNSKHTKDTQKSSWLTAENLAILHSLSSSRDWLLPENKKKKRYKELVAKLGAMLVRWMSFNRKSLEQLLESEFPSKQITQLFHADLSRLKSTDDIAYNPTFIKIVEQEFKIILENEKEDYPLVIPQQKHTHLVLPGLRVSNANAESCAYLVGLPSMIGIFGFIHNLQRQLDSRFGLSAGFEQFAICMHEYSFHKRGLTKEQVQISKKQLRSPAIIDSRQCDFALSLVIKTSAILQREEVLAALPQKICGGAVHIPLSELEGINTHHSFESAVNAIPVKNGKWITPSFNSLSTTNFIDFLDKTSVSYNLNIACVGYHYLETPFKKNSASDDPVHAFAEPILAGVQLNCIASFGNIERFFWHYSETSTSLYLGSKI